MFRTQREKWEQPESSTLKETGEANPALIGVSVEVKL